MRLGPIAHVTLVVPDLEVALAAYQGPLAQRLLARESLAREEALRLGALAYVGAPSAWLACPGSDAPWLRLIEDRTQPAAAAFARLGWMAIELLVADVDALASQLGAHFKVLRPPADLDFSDAIRACQVQGPGGEVLYLTQVRRPVPPFELPLSTDLSAAVGPPFVMVLACRDLIRSSGFYAGLGAVRDFRFQTCLSALNQAQGLALTQKHSVHVWQLRAGHLLELDQATAGMLAVARPDARLPAGIAHVALARSNADGVRLDQRHKEAQSQVMSGPDGESLELI